MFFYNIIKKNMQNQSTLIVDFKFIMLCLFTFWTTPSIAIKIIIEVEPAEINGSGSPVGGTSPVTTY